MSASVEGIIKIARQARQWAMRNRHKEGFESDLMGMCAISAADLFTRLTKAGFRDVRIAANLGHCFVQCGGYVVDVTATQFGRRAVEVVPVGGASHAHFWCADHVFNSIDELRVHQLDEGWPSQQICDSAR